MKQEYKIKVIKFETVICNGQPDRPCVHGWGSKNVYFIIVEQDTDEQQKRCTLEVIAA